MPTYDEWNSAIAEYFCEDLLPGTSFYLSVDDNTLAEIGALNFGGMTDSEYVNDFIREVRRRAVYGSAGRKRIGSSRINDTSLDGLPNCIAFLSATVLAAYRMTPDEVVAGTNYFTRLREVLGFPTHESGRPTGLSEVSLWWIFNRWVQAQGWLPSAVQGYGGRRYINYPISQTLLRSGDKERLEEAFKNQRLYSRDREQIYAWFLRHGGDLNAQHLRGLAQAARDPSDERANAILDAVYEVYTHTDWIPSASPTQTSDSRPASPAARRASRAPTQLSAGLYREEDPIWGTVEYWLYPRMPNHRIGGNLSVVRNGIPKPLEEDRDNRFRPLWPVDSFEGAAYDVEGSARPMKLVLPQREFWILTTDPYDESSGIFASWGSPNLGDAFMILCRNRYRHHLELLRNDNLLVWEDAEELIGAYSGWTEFRGCKITSPNWGRALNSDIFDELRPNARASISTTGGLRSGRRLNEWLEGYLPQIIVATSDDSKIQLFDVSDPNAPIIDSGVGDGESIGLPDLEPGAYTLEITASGRRAALRAFSVTAWDSLQADAPIRSFHTPVGDHVLNGALLSTTEAVQDAPR